MSLYSQEIKKAREACVSIPSFSASTELYIPELEGDHIRWGSTTLSVLESKFDNNYNETVGALIKGTQDLKGDELREYLAELAQIHCCVIEFLPDRFVNTLLLDYRVIMKTLEMGFLTTFLDLTSWYIDQNPGDDNTIRKLSKEVIPTSYLINLLVDDKDVSDLVRRYPDSEAAKLVDKLAEETPDDDEDEVVQVPSSISEVQKSASISTTNLSDDECLIPRRPERQSVDVIDEDIPDIALNSAANLREICCCINDSLKHIERLQIHDRR